MALDPVLSVLVNWKPITELNKMKLFKNDLQVTHISSRKLTMYYMQLNLEFTPSTRRAVSTRLPPSLIWIIVHFI